MSSVPSQKPDDAQTGSANERLRESASKWIRRRRTHAKRRILMGLDRPTRQREKRR